MKIPLTARYNYCCNKANEFLIKENITQLPFDSDTIIKKYKWAKLKYSDLAKALNVTVEDIAETYDSNDGYSIYTGRNYSIAYNDTISTKQRIYFTKLHEIGHIYLGHFIDFEATILNRSNMTKDQYKVLENEANCFARNVLVPVTLIENLKIENSMQISSIFEITLPASQARLGLLKNDLYYLSTKNIRLQKTLFYNFIHKKQCLQCGHAFISEIAKYCPICGHNRLTRGDGKMIYNDGFELNSDGKILNCPRCSNEQISLNRDHCKICGVCLINRCSQAYGYSTCDGNVDPCGQIADGNARYCEYCGSQTTFFQQGFLKDWETVQQEINEAEEFPGSTKVVCTDIPF